MSPPTPTAGVIREWSLWPLTLAQNFLAQEISIKTFSFFFRVPHIRSPSHQDDLEDSRGGGQTTNQNGQTPMLTMATSAADSRVVVSMINNGEKR